MASFLFVCFRVNSAQSKLSTDKVHISDILTVLFIDMIFTRGGGREKLFFKFR